MEKCFLKRFKRSFGKQKRHCAKKKLLAISIQAMKEVQNTFSEYIQNSEGPKDGSSKTCCKLLKEITPCSIFHKMKDFFSCSKKENQGNQTENKFTTLFCRKMILNCMRKGMSCANKVLINEFVQFRNLPGI